MENLVSGLIVAAATGLSFIAYRHPEEYRRVVWFLLTIGAVMALLSVVYRNGLATGARFAHKPEALNDVLDILTEWSWVGFGIVAYAVCLEALPWLLKLRKQDQIKRK